MGLLPTYHVLICFKGKILFLTLGNNEKQIFKFKKTEKEQMCFPTKTPFAKFESSI